jgi:hypothetical protein
MIWGIHVPSLYLMVGGPLSVSWKGLAFDLFLVGVYISSRGVWPEPAGAFVGVLVSPVYVAPTIFLLCALPWTC